MCPGSDDPPPASARPFPFDAVIFDLDGTLVATERFWVAAAETGARRAFQELGLARELPSAAEWLSMVGLPIDTGFALVFPDLDPAARRRVMEACVEEESAALAAGGAALLPGALEALRELSSLGVQLGIASNCGAGYLEHMLRALPLGEWIDEARCLDSPGVHSKADMVGDLLATFGTRSAVMVGDRATDGEAARAHGVPHVHVAGGMAPAGETVEAEARLAHLGELLPRLSLRARWIESALTRLSLLRDGAPLAGGAASLGVTGNTASGKSLFARDVARLVESRGRPAVVVPLADYARPGAAADVDGESLLERITRAFDCERLIAEVLEPHRAGREVRTARGVQLAPEALLVVEGPFLLHPRLSLALDRVLHLELDETRTLGRVAARDGGEALLEARRRTLPLEREFLAAFPPAERADLRLDASNPLGPEGGPPRG